MSQPAPAPRKRGCLANIVRYSVIAIIVIVVIGVLANLLGEPDPQPSAPPAVVATVAPTEPPTATPEPAPTEALAEPAGDADLAAYAAQVMGPGQRIIDAMGDMERLTTEPKPDDQTWIVEVAGALLEIQIAHEEMSAVEPPARFAETHAKLLEATGQCEAMTHNFSAGVDNRDTVALDAGLAQLGECNTLFNEATALLAQAMQGQ